MPGRGAHVDFPGVFFDDAVAHGEAQAGAAAGGFGGEERIEDAVQIFARNADAGVGDFHFHGAVVRRCAHFEHAAGGHGVARIHEEIQEHLLRWLSSPAPAANLS